MAPDSKHRKDPTDPHLKFMTRSRRLILVTRDHMNSVGRISAEIHELSQSILADHDDFLRARSNLQIDDDPGEEKEEEEEDINIQREVSFDVINTTGRHQHKHPPSNYERKDDNSVKLPIRYPHIPNLNIQNTRENRDISGRKHKTRHMTKLPLVPKVSGQDMQRMSARIYQNPQIPYAPHKPSPRIKQEPADANKAPSSVKAVPRLNLHKLRLDDKNVNHLPLITNKPIVRRKSALEKKYIKDTTEKPLPVLIKQQVPVYRAPMQIMQPPGYAPRLELRLPRFVVKDCAKESEKTDAGECSAVKRDTLPQIVLNNCSFQGRLRTGTIRRTNRHLQEPTTRENNEKNSIHVAGKTLNEVIVPGRKRPDTQEKSRGMSRDGDRRKTLKRKETVILPKVNPCPLVSPDYKGQHFHRPSYLITSPVPVSHLAPTASLESCMSLSPMPHIHQMTLTPRQTMLISGSPTNLFATSRPGSMIRETPVPGTITRFPKLVATSEVSTGH